jgi:hypothetical protein
VPNNIKRSGGGLALQVTKAARRAGLVEENADSEATRLSEVVIYGFDDVLLVVDRDRVAVSDRAELVAALAQDTDSVHEGQVANLEIAGNGYQVQLPGCERAGFNQGTAAPVVSQQGILLIHDGTQGRLAQDVATIREEQVSR